MKAPQTVAYIDNIVRRALSLGGEATDTAISAGTVVTEKLLARSSSSTKPVTLTIARPRDEVEKFWSDEAMLSRVLGDVCDVVATSRPNGYRWNLHLGGDHDVVWQSELIQTADGLRFVGADDGPTTNAIAHITVGLHDAPRDLGTEVTLTLGLPGPDMVLRTATFKALYRARALLQTGELPTLTPTPAARPGNR